MGLHFLSGSFVAEVTQPSGLWALWSGYFLQEGLHQRRHSQTAAASPLCPCDEPLLTHTSTGYPPTLAGSFGSVSCGVTALFLWVLVHARFCLCPWKLESVSPVLWKWNSACLWGQIPWGFPVTLLGPQAGKLDMVFWTFTTVGELLWDYCSPVCGSPTQWVWDLSSLWLCPSYHLAVASSLSLDMGYLFWWVPAFCCRWLFNNWLWFWCSRRRRCCTRLYSIILNRNPVLLILKLP